MSRDQKTVVLALATNPPIQLEPPTASGAEMVDASPEEWRALRQHGFNLPWV